MKQIPLNKVMIAIYFIIVLVTIVLQQYIDVLHVRQYNELVIKYNELVTVCDTLADHNNSSYRDLWDKYIKRPDCESCALYSPNAKYGVNGVYHHPNYYCVWTKGRNESEIVGTECHEQTHYLVARNYEHFCCEYPFGVCKDE